MASGPIVLLAVASPVVRIEPFSRGSLPTLRGEGGQVLWFLPSGQDRWLSSQFAHSWWFVLSSDSCSAVVYGLARAAAEPIPRFRRSRIATSPSQG
jgi:hypothetical protein